MSGPEVCQAPMQGVPVKETYRPTPHTSAHQPPAPSHMCAHLWACVPSPCTPEGLPAKTTFSHTQYIEDLMAGLILCDIPKAPFFIKQFLKSFMTPWTIIFLVKADWIVSGGNYTKLIVGKISKRPDPFGRKRKYMLGSHLKWSQKLMHQGNKGNFPKSTGALFWKCVSWELSPLVLLVVRYPEANTSMTPSTGPPVQCRAICELFAHDWDPNWAVNSSLAHQPFLELALPISLLHYLRSFLHSCCFSNHFNKSVSSFQTTQPPEP